MIHLPAFCSSLLLSVAGVLGASAAEVLSQQPKLADIADATALHQAIASLDAESQAKALAQLAAVPKHDLNSLHAAADGSLCYACVRVAPAPSGRVGLRESTLNGSIPVSSPPKFHSKPGAAGVLFLDFNGGTVSGTQWNKSADIDSWKLRPYSADQDFTTFSDQEQADIKRIWEMVAEDFAPFNLDVTTEEPEVRGSNTGWALITDFKDENGKDTPMVRSGGIAGGVAYLNKFGASDFQFFSPAWVLDYHSADLDLVQYMADTISHEFGHNLGLNHDGNSRQEYEGGFGASGNALSWGPIMGGGTFPALTQWSKGEYRDASNQQDDLAVISKLLPFSTDDHGGVATPTAIKISDKSFSATGVIAPTGEVDAFKISLGAGKMTAVARSLKIAGSDTNGANLDIKLTLTTLSGSVVATANSLPGTDATIDTTVTAGTHLLLVEPTGAGNPTNSDGYTVYGSLGQYVIKGTGLPGSSNNGSDVGVIEGPGVENNFLGNPSNDQPGPNFDGASAGDSSSSCGLGSGLAVVLGGLLLLALRLRRQKIL